MKKVTTESWIKAATNIHGNTYDYSKVKYTMSKNKVCIICPIHGEFYQAASDHLKGRGCCKCGHIKNEKVRRLTLEDFIQKANKIHNNLYDYSKVVYKNAREKLEIVCLKHGSFLQNANNHLQGQGCPICKYSKGELLIYNWLKDNKIKFKTQFELTTNRIARNSNLIIVDFFIKHNNKQYFIEYDGKQHFEYVPYFHKGGLIDFEKQLRRDEILNSFCKQHNDKLTLLRFRYDETDDVIINKLTDILNN